MKTHILSAMTINTAAAMLLCTGVGSAAHAQTKTPDPQGLYLGAGVGQFKAQIDDIDGAGPIVQEFDAEDTSFKLFAGWRFGKYFGVELAYIDFGGPDDTLNGVKVKTEVSGFAPYAVGTLPLGKGNFELFAKAGYMFYDTDIDVGGRAANKQSSEDMIYGVGAGMMLLDHLNVALEYELLDVSDPLDDAEALWLSAAWRF